VFTHTSYHHNRYGKDCHYGPSLCRYSHSYLEEEAEEIRLQLEAQYGADPFADEEDIPLTDDEGYASDHQVEAFTVFGDEDTTAEVQVIEDASNAPVTGANEVSP
jgi:hypothetical protein